MPKESTWWSVEQQEEEELDDSEDDRASTEKSASGSSDEDDPTASYPGFVSSEFYLSRNRLVKWYLIPGEERTVSAKETARDPGVKKRAAGGKTITDAWNLFFPQKTLMDLVNRMNVKLQAMRANYKRPRDVANIDVPEMQGFIGILYMAGLVRSSFTNVNELWENDGTAPEFFRAVMSKKRFRILMAAFSLENDDEEKPEKKFAPVQKFFNDFSDRCGVYYEPGEYCTVDEIKEPFRGGKPSFKNVKNMRKRDAKIFCLVDSETFYTLGMKLYIRRSDVEAQHAFPDIVKRLITPIAGTGRNITCVQPLLTVPFAKYLLKNYKVSMVGMLHKKDQDIPLNFVKFREDDRAFVGYHENCVLTSFVKNNRRSVLLSTMDGSEEFYKTEATDYCSVPEIVSFYNVSNQGVSMIDNMTSVYSTARSNSRYSLMVFFYLLNVAGMNSQIVYKLNTGHVITRRDFLKNLALEISKPYLAKRSDVTTNPYLLRMQIKSMVKAEDDEAEENDEAVQRTVKCAYCPRRKNRKTKTKCSSCESPICGEHTHCYCPVCVVRNRRKRTADEEGEVDELLKFKVLKLGANVMEHGGKFMTIGDKIRLPDDVTMGYIIEHLLRKPLTVIEEFHSHLEPMKFLQPETFHKQITFSYSQYGKDELNVLKIDGFDLKTDPTRFYSLHCYLFPRSSLCPR